MLTSPRNSQSGFGLVELMIAMVVGFIIVGGALFLATSSMKASRDNIRVSFLNQELRNVLNLMTRDLKRASYWGGALDAVMVSQATTLTFGATSGSGISITQEFKTADVSDTVVDRLGAAAVGATLVYLEAGTAYRATITAYSASTNTYTATLTGTFPTTVLAANGGAGKGTWLFIGPAPAVTVDLAGDDCAVFSYDMNGNGLITTSDPDERVGFRYDSTEKAVEIRQGGTGCGGTGWLNVTDENAVEITGFTITDYAIPAVSGSVLSVTVREYTIEIAGRLRSDNNVTRAVRETIRVRNNEIS